MIDKTIRTTPSRSTSRAPQRRSLRKSEKLAAMTPFPDREAEFRIRDIVDPRKTSGIIKESRTDEIPRFFGTGTTTRFRKGIAHLALGTALASGVGFVGYNIVSGGETQIADRPGTLPEGPNSIIPVDDFSDLGRVQSDSANSTAGNETATTLPVESQTATTLPGAEAAPTTTVLATTTDSIIIGDEIIVGATGPRVTELQTAFGEIGCRDIVPFEIDGIFGDDTKAVVEEFQRRASLGVDGRVGDGTQVDLIAARAAGDNTCGEGF